MTDHPQGKLSGRVIVVTGSTRGIGEAIAERCAADGARVVVTGRSEERGLQVVERIEQRGGEARFIRADITDEESMRRLFSETLCTWGRVSGIVANAASLDLGHQDGPITEITFDHWNRMISANLTSVFLTMKFGLKAIMEGGVGGSVVLIGSLGGVRAIIGQDGYAAAKGAIVQLNRTIATYYSRYKIRCNCLNLGFVDSGSDRIEHVLKIPGFGQQLLDFHLGSWGRAAEVGTVVSHLLSDEAAYVSGAEIAVDGGASAASHMPRPMVSDIPGFPAVMPTVPGAADRGA
jgi:NAD(P)-dependent dehydrogenase (short-subunit alcohol dehydrogenase family)